MTKRFKWGARASMLVLMIGTALHASVAVSHHHEPGAAVEGCARCPESASVAERAEPSPGCAPAAIDEKVELSPDAPIVAGCTPETRD